MSIMEEDDTEFRYFRYFYFDRHGFNDIEQVRTSIPRLPILTSHYVYKEPVPDA